MFIYTLFYISTLFLALFIVIALMLVFVSLYEMKFSNDSNEVKKNNCDEIKTLNNKISLLETKIKDLEAEIKDIKTKTEYNELITNSEINDLKKENNEEKTPFLKKIFLKFKK